MVDAVFAVPAFLVAIITVILAVFSGALIVFVSASLVIIRILGDITVISVESIHTSSGVCMAWVCEIDTQAVRNQGKIMTSSHFIGASNPIYFDHINW